MFIIINFRKLSGNTKMNGNHTKPRTCDCLTSTIIYQAPVGCQGLHGAGQSLMDKKAKF